MLPQEAFPLRHEIVDTPPGPEHLQDKADSPHVSGSEADAGSLAPVDSSFSLLSVSHVPHDSRLPPDFFSSLVCDMLRFYAEQGDVQMAVSVLIVLGERVRKDIDEQTQVGRRVGRRAGRRVSRPSGWHPPHLGGLRALLPAPRSTGTCPTSTCCSASASGTCPMRW